MYAWESLEFPQPVTHLTSSMTYSLGAFLTSSPLICTTWSPGRSLSSLGPPASQTKISSKKTPMVQMIILSWFLWSKWNGSNLTSMYSFEIGFYSVSLNFRWQHLCAFCEKPASYSKTRRYRNLCTVFLSDYSCYSDLTFGAYQRLCLFTKGWKNLSVIRLAINISLEWLLFRATKS